MNLVELKEKLPYKPKNQSWLQNGYPARPEDRCQKITKENYQNLDDCFGVVARKELQKFIKEKPDVPVVVLAPLSKTGKISSGKSGKPRLFIGNEALYYPQYELFACSANLDGFIEVFHHGVKK